MPACREQGYCQLPGGDGGPDQLLVLTRPGKTQLVKSYLDEFPRYLTAGGPQGFTLLHPAQKEGEEAKELLDYLQSKGLKDTQAKL